MVRLRLISVALLFVAAGSMTGGASAITAELAKKCRGLTTKAFPPRVVGNPAAGSAKGSGKDAQAYFNSCVKNDGKVDDSASKEQPSRCARGADADLTGRVIGSAR